MSIRIYKNYDTRIIGDGVSSSLSLEWDTTTYGPWKVAKPVEWILKLENGSPEVPKVLSHSWDGSKLIILFSKPLLENEKRELKITAIWDTN